jgi:hypothetical protein
MYRKTTIACAAFAALIGLGGCAENKLTRQNFDMIREGQSTKMEVEMTLGEEYAVRGANEWEYEDWDRSISAKIEFDENGVVANKEWRDGGSGEWAGQDRNIDPSPPGRKVSDSKSTTTINKP